MEALGTTTDLIRDSALRCWLEFSEHNVCQTVDMRVANSLQ